MKTGVLVVLRMLLAVAVAALLGAVATHLLWRYVAALHSLVYDELWLWGLRPGARLHVPVLEFVFGLAYPFSTLVAVGVYTLLAFRRRPPDGNTYCGSCGYILKGLTVPRCPECGKPI